MKRYVDVSGFLFEMSEKKYREFLKEAIRTDCCPDPNAYGKYLGTVVKALDISSAEAEDLLLYLIEERYGKVTP